MYTVKIIEKHKTFIQYCHSAVLMERGSDEFASLSKGKAPDTLAAYVDVEIDPVIAQDAGPYQTLEIKNGDRFYMTDRYGNTVLAFCPS